MEKLIVMIMIPLAIGMFTDCQSDENKVKETVSAYLAKRMKNSASFKIVSIEIREDTIPCYLTNEILDLAEKYNDAADEFLRYADMSHLFLDEKIESKYEMTAAEDRLKETYDSARANDSSEVQSIAYVKYSGTNAMGGTISQSTIIIIDKKNPAKILGSFDIDTDFIKQFMTIKMKCENYKFPQNKFGKFETEGMTYLEKFIMNDC